MSDQFFSTAAQVIPLLLLVLAFEQRAYDIRILEVNAQPRAMAASVIVTTAFIALAEALALWGAGSGSQFAAHTIFVAGGVLVVGIMVLAGLLAPWIAVLRQPRDRE